MIKNIIITTCSNECLNYKGLYNSIQLINKNKGKNIDLDKEQENMYIKFIGKKKYDKLIGKLNKRTKKRKIKKTFKKEQKKENKEYYQSVKKCRKIKEKNRKKKEEKG